MLSKKTVSQVLVHKMPTLSLIHWHIELSSICTLKCPRCPRVELPESLLNEQLTLDFFKKQIGANIIKQIKKITFCGNDGDPIYCNDFIPIVQWIKKVNPTICIVIITNGSYKKTAWWEELAHTLTKHDEIHWSIDGWDQLSNKQYRINSDWDSIMNGIKTFAHFNKSSYKVWAAIAFRFNECAMNDMENLAKENLFDCFQLTHSTKFGSKYPGVYGILDPLEPSKDFIPSGHRFKRLCTAISNKERFSDTIKLLYEEIHKTLADPKLCFIGNKGLFLNSHGEFYPCCWVATRYEHNAKWTNRGKEKFNLHNRTCSEILSDSFWTGEFMKFDNLECKTKCVKDSNHNIGHFLEW
jgi:MoaA/NifB/PqqE/SkfB family radical SAM enzyme